MLLARDLTVAVDGDGVSRVFLQHATKRVHHVRLRCPDDTFTADELKAKFEAKGWGRPPYYTLQTGVLEAWFYTDKALPAFERFILDDFCELDTIAETAIAPGSSFYGRMNYAALDDRPIPELPAEVLELVAAHQKERAEIDQERDRRLTILVDRFNNIGRVPDAAEKEEAWPWLAEMNARHAVIQRGGKTMVHEIVRDHELGNL